MTEIRRKSAKVPRGTYNEFRHAQLKPNPLNPRRLFDRAKLDTLRESIRKVGILVPLTVYQETRTGQHYILDGERRWRCVEEIETDLDDPRQVDIPANVVDAPTKAANLLRMFNIHNLRESWELMPTALSLRILMEDLEETDDAKLAELTQLSTTNVRRCKILLSYPDKYYQLMLAEDSEERIRANFFIELQPVLDLYERLPKRCSGGKSRGKLTDHFLSLYKKGKIASVIHFRRILEAYDYLKEDSERFDSFETAARQIATSTEYSVRQLFDPLVAEDKSVSKAEDLCRDFLKGMRRLKGIAHTRRRARLRKLLLRIQKHVARLLSDLEE